MLSLPIGTLCESTAAREQLASSGPYSRKETLPDVGLYSPERRTASVSEPPTATDCDAVAASVGAALTTATDPPASLQAPLAGWLLTSPP